MFSLLPALFLGSAVAGQQQEDQASEELQVSTVIKTVRWTEETRDAISSSILTTARSIDSWMSGEISEGKNKSRINIGVEQSFEKSGEMETDFYIRGKLDIPNTKRKLKLFFDSDTNDQSSLEDKRLNNNEESFSTAGVSRERTGDVFDLSHDIGAKFKIPFDPFYRFKAKHKRELNELWKMGFEQRLWYYHRKGWGESSELNFTRLLGDQHSVIFTTEIQYQNRYEEFEFGQFATLRQAIPGNHWHSFTLGITGSSQPDQQTDSVFLSASYNQLIYKDWLILSARPILRFPDSDNWKPNPELEIRLDVFFQETTKRN
ncbi:hypothetical protein [Candidatus Pelagadaptatus aseana]|uniref:hypothetical protein n=1 Tax=Candidatus Pelagadaptatus aseana TaxID=3120508 RepID=UPI003C702C97